MRIAYNPKSAEPLKVAPSGNYLNAITFDLAAHKIYTRGEVFMGTDTTYEVFKKHTTSENKDGVNGLVPVPSYSTSNVRFLREDGTWVIPSNTHNHRPIAINGTPILNNDHITLHLIGQGPIILTPQKDSASKYTGDVTIAAPEATQSQAGFMSSADKLKLDNMTFTPGDGFSGTLADAFTTVKVGTSSITAVSGKQILSFVAGSGIDLLLNTIDYALQISGKVMVGADGTNNGTAGFVPAPSKNDNIAYLRGDGTWNRLSTDQILSLTGYTIGTKVENLATSDTLNAALGKLEYKANLGEQAYNIINAATNDNGTIENLNEILKVLEGISDTDTIKLLIGKYLPLTGGILTNDGSDILTINRTSGNPLIKFTTNGTLKGYLGISTDSIPVYVNSSGNISNILHSTNYSSYLPTLDGDNMTLDTDLYTTTGVVNGQSIDFITSSESTDFTLFAPSELGQENWLLQSTGTGLTWVDPATIGAQPAIEITKSLKVTRDWMDTNVTGLDTGTYIVQVTVNGGNMSNCIWSGVMSWYGGTCSGTEADEIILHRSGKSYSNTIYLRTIMQNSGVLKLQIAADETMASEYSYSFKFKKMI